MRGKITEQAMIMGFHRTKSGDSPLLVDYCKAKLFEGLSINPYLAQNGITANGKLYKVDTDVTILDSVVFGGSAYIKTPISSYTNKGVFEIEFAAEATSTVKFLTGQNPETSINNIGIFNYSAGLACQNGAGSRTVLSNIGTAKHTLVMEDGKVTLDGAQTSMASVAEFTVNQDLYIGAATSPSTGALDTRCFKGTIYRYAHKNASGEYDLYAYGAIKNNLVGMYDLISGQFIAPTGTLTAGKTTKTVNVHSEIPVEQYQEVEYLGLQGNEHINTAIVPSNKKIGAVIDFQFTDTSRNTGGVFGSNNNDGTDNCQFTVYESKWRTKLNSFAHYGARYDTNRHIVRFNMSNGTKLDDTVITATQYTIASSNDRPLFLGRCNYGSGSSDNYSLIGRLYSSQIYVDGVLTLDYVPVKRLSDDTYGMYDLVSKTFFGNAGTGAFTGGSARQMEVPICSVERSGDKMENLFDMKYNVGYAGTYPNITEVSGGKSTEWIETDKFPGNYFWITWNVKANLTSCVMGLVYSNDKETILERRGIVNSAAQGVTPNTDCILGGGGAYVLSHTYKYVKAYCVVWSNVNRLGFYASVPTEYIPYGWKSRIITSCQGRIADMSTLNWNPAGNGCFYVAIADKANGRNICCTKYPTDQSRIASSTADMHIGGHDGNRVYFKNTSIEQTRGAAQADLRGVPLYYQRTSDSAYIPPQITDVVSDMLQGSIDAVSGLESEGFDCKELDGTETVTKLNAGDRKIYWITLATGSYTTGFYTIFSSHFKYYLKTLSNIQPGECSCYSYTGADIRFFFGLDVETVAEAKAILAALKASGNPAKVWFPKATPTQSQGTAHTIQGISGNMTAECKQSKTITAKYRSNTV